MPCFPIRHLKLRTLQRVSYRGRIASPLLPADALLPKPFDVGTPGLSLASRSAEMLPLSTSGERGQLLASGAPRQGRTGEGLLDSTPEPQRGPARRLVKRLPPPLLPTSPGRSCCLEASGQEGFAKVPLEMLRSHPTAGSCRRG